MTALWSEIHHAGGAVQHVRIPLSVVCVDPIADLILRIETT